MQLSTLPCSARLALSLSLSLSLDVATVCACNAYSPNKPGNAEGGIACSKNRLLEFAGPISAINVPWLAVTASRMHDLEHEYKHARHAYICRAPPSPWAHGRAQASVKHVGSDQPRRKQRTHLNISRFMGTMDPPCVARNLGQRALPKPEAPTSNTQHGDTHLFSMNRHGLRLLDHLGPTPVRRAILAARTPPQWAQRTRKATFTHSLLCIEHNSNGTAWPYAIKSEKTMLRVNCKLATYRERYNRELYRLIITNVGWGACLTV